MVSKILRQQPCSTPEIGFSCSNHLSACGQTPRFEGKSEGGPITYLIATIVEQMHAPGGRPQCEHLVRHRQTGCRRAHEQLRHVGRQRLVPEPRLADLVVALGLACAAEIANSVQWGVKQGPHRDSRVTWRQNAILS